MILSPPILPLFFVVFVVFVVPHPDAYAEGPPASAENNPGSAHAGSGAGVGSRFSK